mmetsp:Transcript_38624/g.115355  ORF Transcript_38624/g.115355 Transcript_38624/m.115355 type:complete len:225 (-) Transcript_38624:1685-2359(-)
MLQLFPQPVLLSLRLCERSCLDLPQLRRVLLVAPREAGLHAPRRCALLRLEPRDIVLPAQAESHDLLLELCDRACLLLLQSHGLFRGLAARGARHGAALLKMRDEPLTQLPRLSGLRLELFPQLCGLCARLGSIGEGCAESNLLQLLSQLCVLPAHLGGVCEGRLQPRVLVACLRSTAPQQHPLRDGLRQQQGEVQAMGSLVPRGGGGAGGRRDELRPAALRRG